MKRKKRVCINGFVPFLFAIYMVLLVWIILFKLQISIRELDTVRNINLIPFHYENEIGIKFHLKEVIENTGIFIPFGIYLCMLRYGPSFRGKCILIFSASLILEICQYIFAIGGTDITDLMTNTCGEMVGI